LLQIFQYYTDRTPGSVIEDKEIGLAWHYNVPDMKFGEWQASECLNHINNSMKAYPIHLLKRKSCLEVYLKNISKATTMRRILQHQRHAMKKLPLNIDTITPTSPPLEPCPNDDFYDFILCIGDDRCDEYMFNYLTSQFGGNNTCEDGMQHKSFSENIFTCTLGRKSSSAQWYIPTKVDLIQGLKFLADLQ
jgi:trehalose 6-phosphate synthase/phosphatase